MDIFVIYVDYYISNLVKFKKDESSTIKHIFKFVYRLQIVDCFLFYDPTTCDISIII